MRKTFKVIMEEPERAEKIFLINEEFSKFKPGDYDLGDKVNLFRCVAEWFKLQKEGDEIIGYYKDERIGKAELDEIPDGQIIGVYVNVGAYKSIDLVDDEPKAVRHKHTESYLEPIVEIAEQPVKQEKKKGIFSIFGKKG